MGTYTTNYNLYIPSIGEQGWGDLVNGNFSTIDTTMKGLSNDIGTLDTEINAVEARVTVLETGEFETVNVVGTITAGEFVGGVGNFSSGLVSGDMQIEGVVSANGFEANNPRTITVSPSTTTLLSNADTFQNIMILPPRLGCVYSGTIKAVCRAANSSALIYYSNGTYSTITYNNTLYTPVEHTFTLPTSAEFAYLANIVNAYLPVLTYS